MTQLSYDTHKRWNRSGQSGPCRPDQYFMGRDTGVGPMGSNLQCTTAGMGPMGSNSQCAAAGDYVNIVVDDKKPTKSSDVYEHIQ